MSVTEDQLNSRKTSVARLYQELYDGTLRKVGMRAPQPVIGQSPDDYRRETLRTMKKQFLANHELNKIQMRALPSEALGAFEPQVLNAVVSEANNPNNVPLGELRQLKVLDELGQVREINWIGQESFVKQMGRPGRRVASFLLNGVHVDASGRALR
jgi:hypothetical protein